MCAGLQHNGMLRNAVQRDGLLCDAQRGAPTVLQRVVGSAQAVLAYMLRANARLGERSADEWALAIGKSESAGGRPALSPAQQQALKKATAEQCWLGMDWRWCD